MTAAVSTKAGPARSSRAPRSMIDHRSATGKLFRSRPFLQAVELDPAEARKRLQACQREGTIAIPGELGISLPGDADAKGWFAV